MMALPPIPPDPEPTDAELLPYFDEWTGLTGRLLRSGAALSWRMAQQAKTPDDFLKPFSPPDHERYLESPIWKEIRKRVLKQAQHRRAGCGTKATQVHHRDYRPRILSGDDISFLVPVCRSCHTRVHKTEDGKPRKSWNEQDRILCELVDAGSASQNIAS